MQKFVPVVDKDQRPLMPTKPKKARRWIKSGKATPFWKKGIFCVRLNVEPSGREMQEICVGIDSGSKREAFTVKSEAHTFLNIQSTAVTWVKKAVKQRRIMRRNRRQRNCPHRVNRKNRARGGIPPSTKARWQWKLRICAWLKKLFPITKFIVEDIKAWTRKNLPKKKQNRWNLNFSPLEVGKRYFYSELEKIASVDLKQGWETKNLRDALGLKKISNKLAEVFEAHCVDSWCLANSWTGGHTEPDNRELLCIVPLQFHRRQLHCLQPDKGGIRKQYGGTRSLDFKRGSLVKHPNYGLVYVGGFLKDRLSLHSYSDGKRLCQNAKIEDCKFLTYASWRSAISSQF